MDTRTHANLPHAGQRKYDGLSRLTNGKCTLGSAVRNACVADNVESSPQDAHSIVTEPNPGAGGGTVVENNARLPSASRPSIPLGAAPVGARGRPRSTPLMPPHSRRWSADRSTRHR